MGMTHDQLMQAGIRETLDRMADLLESISKVLHEIQAAQIQKAAEDALKPKRGRPPKIIKDIDRSKVDEVIYDCKKPEDVLRSQISFGKARRKHRQY
jgi:hypothetical protein